jgi:choline dehydrogenase-like flavoprotein
MGNDPKRSVVDRNNRAHDIANLPIADGGSLVTAGRQQPTATIQALAIAQPTMRFKRPSAAFSRPDR